MSFPTSKWEELLLHYSPTSLELYGTLMTQLIFFWGISAVYLLLPYLFPAFSARHKLQNQGTQPKPSELWDCFLIVARNQLVTTILHIGILRLGALSKRPPSYRFDSVLPSSSQTVFPSPSEIIRDLAVGCVLRDIMFYYTHRLFHHPTLYPLIHKRHHRFTAPVALAAQYASVTEHIFVNILPVSLPFMIMRSHIVTFWLFLASQLVETTTVHSGYDFFARSAQRHDLHHEKSVVNFGTMGLVDWVHGTNKGREVKEKKIEVYT